MAEGKFIIKAQNDIKEGLDAAKNDLNGFADVSQSIANKVKQIFSFAAAVKGLEELGKAAFECFQEFGESERRLKQLKIALDDNQESFSKATDLIDKLKTESLASKDDIEGLVTELASLGKSDKEINAIATAAVNLSNVTGKDLNASFATISSTFSGTAGKLEKLVPEIGNLTKEQLAAGGAADIINQKFGEMSQQLAEDNIPQKIKNIKDAWSEFRENLGQAVAPAFNPIIDAINAIITKWFQSTRPRGARRFG